MAWWKTKCLSIGRRTTLLKNNSQSVPQLFPLSFLNTSRGLHWLEKFFKRFWWGGTEEKEDTLGKLGETPTNRRRVFGMQISHMYEWG